MNLSGSTLVFSFFAVWILLSASCYASLSCNDTRNSYVEGTASIDFTSKVLSYGLPDSSKPNLLPYGELTFFDCLSAGSRFYIDLTDIGERMGRGDRTCDLWEVDLPVDLRKRFTSEDCVWIPTCVEIGIGYRYEYHPSRTHISDTQFWLADISLPDIWVVPRLSYERDVIRDNGTYLNFSLSKEIEIFDSVSIVPSVSQGWGDVRRVAGYLPGPDMVGRLDHSGLMDASFRLDLVWKVSERVSVSVFTAYSEFLFDRDIRESARNYIRQSDAGAHNRSWSIPFGLSVKVSM